LAGIALKYSISVEDLKKANKLADNSQLFARKILIIPPNVQ
jgi:hypothetical protein